MLGRSWWLISLVALLGGCAPGNPGLLILNVVAPNERCEYDVGNLQYSRGVLDVSAVAADPVFGGYVASLRYGNQLINLAQSGATGAPMADPNVTYVQQVEVELLDVAGAPLGISPNPYTVPAGGSAVPSSEGGDAGEAIGSAQIIPPSVADALTGSAGTTIIASMRAVGITAGNAEVVSPEFTFPITLCEGCLLRCDTDSEGEPICTSSCTPGQDTVTSTCPGC